MLTQERLKARLRYVPTTGKFYHRVTSGRAVKGAEAGTVHGKHGHIAVKVDGVRYLAHRVAWLYMTGAWPEGKIDHRDRAPANNRWKNLRPATHAQNIANSRLRKDSSSGVKGVYQRADRPGKWLAHCAGKHLGQFDTKLEAITARFLAAKDRWGEYA